MGVLCESVGAVVAEAVGETELLDPKKGSGVCVGRGGRDKKK